MVVDVNGLEISKGDTVAPLTGDFKGKVCDLKTDLDTGFVCVRASHRPYSKGVWYASEHVQRLNKAKIKPEDEVAKKDASKKAAAKAKAATIAEEEE